MTIDVTVQLSYKMGGPRDVGGAPGDRKEGVHNDTKLPPPPPVMTSTPLRSGGDARPDGIGRDGGQARPTVSGLNKTLLDRKCTYRKGGHCRIHGGGAKLKFRPSWKTVVGPDGKQERVYEKKGYYVCDLGQEGGG